VSEDSLIEPRKQKLRTTAPVAVTALNEPHRPKTNNEHTDPLESLPGIRKHDEPHEQHLSKASIGLEYR